MLSAESYVAANFRANSVINDYSGNKFTCSEAACRRALVIRQTEMGITVIRTNLVEYLNFYQDATPLCRQ